MEWQTLTWFSFYSAILGRRIYVPPRFLTDFHSVPRGLWNILPPHENPEAGVIHDWLYKTNGVTRKEADQVYVEVLELLNKWHPGKAPAWKRKAMYWGVRMGGWKPWNAYRKKDEKRCQIELKKP